MSKVIRIGTRDSELALWQANDVKEKLEALGHQIQLVPVKSAGDIVLDKPLYELGITGIFTKALDVAMLNGEIDIAVHSMKDVPTALPNGIVQAAVLERGNFLDILAFKDNEEFLAHPEATIATGSLRRKAQWLNRYPTHTVVDLRGNVNSRIEKLNNNDWNGAIFAAAGLERIGLEHEHTIGLTWMVPAPAQGAIMVVAMEADEEIRAICAELNHERTEICVTQEREFLRLLEGGCTAPIGGLCYINNDDKVVFKGVLLTVDGTKKLEAEISVNLGEHQNLGKDCADSILARGGKRLMSNLGELERKPTVFSTKKLTSEQRQLFDKRMKIDSDDFVKIYSNRIPAAELKKEIQNVIITSKNAVEALFDSVDTADLKFKNIYCVGRRTKKLIESRIGKVTHVAPNAKALAEHLVEYMEGVEVTYFCSNIRLDELPNILEKNNIQVTEVVAYETKHAAIDVPDGVKRVLLFSPSGVESFMSKNTADKKVAYCIGETTATEARKHFKDVRVAKIPSVESVIELVNTKIKSMSIKNDLFLKALKGETVERPPVWMMRQAGRYLPEFMEIKAKYDFFTRCQTPELASEITVQPIRRYGMDAAILFSDILVIPQAMNIEVEMKPNFGPYLPNPIRSQKDLDSVIVPDVNDALGYVMEAIKATKEKLNDEVPLIGFAGSPWTILCYCVQGQGSKNFDKAKELCFTQPVVAHELLQKITDTTIAYLKAKVKAGVNAVQVFDSWGGMLSPPDYQEFSWQYIQQIIDALKDEVPVIVFGKGCWFALGDMAKSGASALGVDWTCSARNARYLTGGKITLQGNFDPSRLLSPPSDIKKMVTQMINEFGKDNYIVNLGHGILPNVPVENAKAFIDAVKEYKSPV